MPMDVITVEEVVGLYDDPSKLTEDLLQETRDEYRHAYTEYRNATNAAEHWAKASSLLLVKLKLLENQQLEAQVDVGRSRRP